MKLSESFGLFGTSIIGEADSKYDRYLPQLHRDGSIAFTEAFDGSRITSMRARRATQWVTTLEDNDDLTYALESAGKRELRTVGSRSTMYVTDARVIFVQDKMKSRHERIVGHIRYPWIDAIVWRPRLGRFKRPTLEIWMHEDFPVKYLGSWHHYVEVELDGTVDPAVIALDLAHRVSAHNLAHGAPAWIHDRLREQSQASQLPALDDTGEGLWECPASVACPHGASYIGDSHPPAEWIGRGKKAPEAAPAASSGEQEHLARSLTILKRMLARGKSIARERGRNVMETDDLLLALLIDSETPVGQLMERHGADYDSVKRQLDIGLPWHERRPDQRRQPERIRLGKRRLRFAVALGLLNTMREINRREDLDDHVGALQCGQQLVLLAERSGVSTVRAFAQVQIGGSHIMLDELTAAHNAFTAAAALRHAPVVTWSAFSSELDPIEVVDNALYGLWQVAEKREGTDNTAEIDALEHLREFRLRYGSDESTAWTADQLARIHGRNDDFAAAAQWGGVAVEEYGRAGNTADAAYAATIVADSHNRLGEPARALPAAVDAIKGAVLAGDNELEVLARFERIKANKALGNITAAWDELRMLLPDARQRNPSMARAIVIQMAEIDPVTAAADAITLADTDIVYYGPRSAEITLAAAQSVLDVNADTTHQFLMHSVRIASAVLTNPDTVTENVDRAFTTLSGALTTTEDTQFTEQAVQLLVGPLRLLDPMRLYREECLNFLKTLKTARRFDTLAALATPIVDRLAETLLSEPEPSSGDMVALVCRQWELSRGLKHSGELEAALDVQEDLIRWMQKVAAISSTEWARLGYHLANYGADLMVAERYSDAHDKQTEAIQLLRSRLSEGDHYRNLLVRTMRVHAQLADRNGDRAVQRSRLQEALTVLDDAAGADWVDRARTEIQDLLASTDRT
ncbi:Clp protease N-terminal domain-containing protein [Rhodococcus rhodochrous]|uniref:Clp protease N-terminal domain-containing protein n=1 Tax=Rhodococcus rhodochrous TaxID=1829 RepID=UPI0002F03C33|nr:Clp protease N-terminal domain-containing protein [Rhodococcus rhodochrous]